MDKIKHHISSYSSLAIVLIVLLFLTFLSVFVATLHFSTFAVGVALLIAAVKGTTVLVYFMHLKYEKRFLQIIVAGIFVIYALVIVITFIDYLLR
jgi:cytochrome c oxidase subunit 4